MTGTIDANVIGVSGGAAYSGCFVSACDGISVRDSATSSANVYRTTITSNSMHHVQAGISSNIGGIANGAPKTSSIVQNNTIGNPDPPSGMSGSAQGRAIIVNSGTLPSSVPQTCVEVSGNIINGGWGDGLNFDSLRVALARAAGSISRVRNWNGREEIPVC